MFNLIDPQYSPEFQAVLFRRAKLTGGVVDRFRRKPFDWRERATCIHLARAQMRALGHRPPAIPDFRSALGAKRALAKTGHDSVESLLDSMLVRVAPLGMWIGDLGLLPGEDGWQAVVIAIGGNKVFGWHGADLSRLQSIEIGKGDFVAAYAVGR